MMLTLRVKSTVPSASSSPLVSASAPSTRSRPKACTRISFFSGPFWTDRATPSSALRSGSSAWAVPGVLVATMSVPALSRAAGSRSVATFVLNSASPLIASPRSSS